MPLRPGRRLGPYEIVAALGAGGMGEVYEATDTRLGRTVAIKVLPEGLGEHPERRARFEREARTVSQLSHPHVCTLHDVGEEEGIHFLVMEHLEGETLAERLERGELPLEETLRHGAQIAEALDAAHSRGIVHRDLKPANVMLTKDGVKLLDFGLARLAAGEEMAEGQGNLPTLAASESPLTEEGTVLGTFPYMAPEQVEGQRADARSDIFALGAVLYEMATGRRAFDGESAASVMSSVLRDEPEPLSKVRPVSPPALDHVVDRCLAKDPERRWQSARDVAEELHWIHEVGSQAGVAAPVAKRRKSRERLAWALFTTASLLALALGLWAWSLRAPDPPVTYLSIDIPSGADSVHGPAVSPDGRHVAYALRGGDDAGLYVRSLDRPEPVRVPGAENARGVVFSPDGRWIAYYDTEAGELRKIPVEGGSPFTICDAHDFDGGDWWEDGTIVFSMGPPSGLWTVPASGGEARPLTETRPRPGEDRADGHFRPRFLPGGREVLFTSWSPGGDPEYRAAIVELVTGEIRTLFEGDGAVYSESGHLLYRRPRDNALVAVPFDIEQTQVVGEPTVIATDVDGLALSRTGTLVYEALRETPLRLVWLDLDGSRQPLPMPEQHYGQISIAPDGGRAAVVIEEANAELEIWLLELERGTSTPITTYRGWDNFPLWTPDGNSIVFSSDRDGPPTLYRVSVEGGEPERLTTDDFAFQRPDGFTPDGRRLVFTHVNFQSEKGGATVSRKRDLRMLDLDSGEVVNLLETPAAEYGGRISPDGRWLAYVSDESGDDEVYLRSFPDLGSKRRVSLGGFTGRLHWGSEGRRLFYGQGGEAGPILMAVEIGTEPELMIGEPRVVLTVPPEMESGDLAPGEERILGTERTGETEREIVVVVGWGQSMEKR